MTVDLVIPVDIEQLLTAFLRADADVSALLGDRVYTTIPTLHPGDTRTFPICRIDLFGGVPPFSDPLILDAPIVQVSVWGDRQRQARLGIDTIRAACAYRLLGTHALGIVKRVDFGSKSYLPDEADLSDKGRPRPRYISTMTITTRPLRGG